MQFIHQTVKEYVRKYQRNLDLPNLPNQLQRRSGYYFLISPNVAYHPDYTYNNYLQAPTPWALPLRKDLFTYAKLLESSIDPLDIPSYMTYMNILQVTARNIRTTDISLWLSGYPNMFLVTLLQQNLVTDLNEWETVFAALAIVNNLVLYVKKTMQISFSLKKWTKAALNETAIPLLHLAAAGPDIVHTRPVDHCAMIEALVNRGWPINHESHFKYGSSILSTAPQMTPLGCLLVQRDLNSRSEETRLHIAETLLKLGANVNCRVFLGLPSDRYVQPLLEYCVRYETAPFVRLFLQHGAQQHTSSNIGLRYSALLRGDREIIEALNDHGVYFNEILVPFERGSVQRALANIISPFPLLAPH